MLLPRIHAASSEDGSSKDIGAPIPNYLFLQSQADLGEKRGFGLSCEDVLGYWSTRFCLWIIFKANDTLKKLCLSRQNAFISEKKTFD